MNVSDDPKNSMLVNGASAVSKAPPKSSIQRKSAVRPRNEPAICCCLFVFCVVHECWGGAASFAGDRRGSRRQSVRMRAEGGGSRWFQRRAQAAKAKRPPLRTRAPSSRLLQYLTKKNMWKTKSSDSEPKKKKLVSRRHASPRRKMRLVLK